MTSTAPSEVTLRMIQAGAKAAEEATGLKMFSRMYRAMKALDPDYSDNVLVDREDLKILMEFAGDHPAWLNDDADALLAQRIEDLLTNEQ